VDAEAVGTEFRTAEVARILGVTPRRVRFMVQAGHCTPSRHGRAFRFHFQDLVLLRAAYGLRKAEVPARRINRALVKLKRQLPADRPLSGVRISAEGGNIVVRDQQSVWQPESGQQIFSFAVADLVTQSNVVVPALRANGRDLTGRSRESASDWFEYGLAIEAEDPNGARRAYERTLELDPDMADAYVNLGRLVHEGGDAVAAAEFYRAALARSGDDAVTHYNLAVALEDQRDTKSALEHYRRAVEVNPQFADAHFNLGRLLEKTGRRGEALRHLMTYRKLTDQA
jgi:tetratricopeptide (TPR) repeat protein